MGTRLNSTLARWLDDQPAAAVDCRACGRFGKCCDFQPFVPNFALGAVLAGGGTLPAASPKFQLRLIGLVPSATFRADRDARGVSPASRHEELCVFFARGKCEIWDHRPGECSAYACVDEDPSFAGEVFAFETTLAQMALVEQGVAADEVSHQIDLLNDPAPGAESTSHVAEAYRRAWAWVRGLSRADIDRWLEVRA